MKVNLIPMSGKGSRFADVGFTLPKPLISVSGKPMILNVIEHAPCADKWIFVLREEHVNNYHIDKVIKNVLPNAEIIIDKNPVGQATTCLLARKFISPDDKLFITACDNVCLYDEEEYNKLCEDSNIDAVVWTFTQRESMRQKPESYGWNILANDGRTIERVSVKVPISDDPYNDHAVVASFLFKRAQDFFDAADLMVSRVDKIKNEFYVDTIPNYLKELGKRSVIFDIDLFVCWGTPAELRDYQYMECACKYENKKLNEEQKRLLPLWKRYFSIKTELQSEFLSIIVPCHNEEKNLPLIAEQFLTLHAKQPFELIFVNNASNDGSAVVFQDLQNNPQYSFLRVVEEKTPGYGLAIMTGLKAAKGNILAWTHADLQTDPEDVFRAYSKYRKSTGHNIVKGYRRKRESFIDVIFTMSMTIISIVFLKMNLKDINAQPKLFSRDLYNLMKSPPNDFSLDLYLLYIAKEKGYNILTIPVFFKQRKNGKSKSAPNLRGKIKTSFKVLRYIIGLAL